MGYASLAECVRDLERHGHLVRIEHEIDARLEAAAIHRRVHAAGGPALLFARVRGCGFPMASNLFGTLDRTRFLFRDTLESVRRLVELKIDPAEFLKHPWRYRSVPCAAWTMRPRRVRSGPILEAETTLDRLPQLVSWPRDGGAFVTLPAVYTEDPDRPGFARSNLGMYRVQISGGRYEPGREVGLHYQIHRGIGVHHAAAIRRGESLRAHVFVGGPPALALSAVMPLPEGLSELMFAGALGGRRVRMIRPRDGGPALCADADFCISGSIDPARTLPEGPFGDHLGYYSLVHDFPVLRVERVRHRRDAVWPFTVVGRPPQEDTAFGAIIHEITGPIIPTVIPGVRAVHAVDAAGVHPLLLAIGSERYVPYAPVRRAQELLTQARAILGQGQLSLAKYLLIVAGEDDPTLDVHDIPAVLRHLLERVDWEQDLHFETRTTIDTLDYSGHGLNAGSKLTIAAAGPPRRTLPTQLPSDLVLPEGFRDPRVVLPGIVAVTAPPFERGTGTTEEEDEPHVARFCRELGVSGRLDAFPLLVLCDDAPFVAESLGNFLWVVFTRSNPAADVHGLRSFAIRKHWGCRGPLAIDARIKPHHAPPLEEDPETVRRVESLAAPGGPLHGLF